MTISFSRILESPEALSAFSDSELDALIAQHSFSSLLHQEKACRHIRRGCPDAEYWIKRGAVYAKDLTHYALFIQTEKEATLLTTVASQDSLTKGSAERPINVSASEDIIRSEHSAIAIDHVIEYADLIAEDISSLEEEESYQETLSEVLESPDQTTLDLGIAAAATAGAEYHEEVTAQSDILEEEEYASEVSTEVRVEAYEAAISESFENSDTINRYTAEPPFLEDSVDGSFEPSKFTKWLGSLKQLDLAEEQGMPAEKEDVVQPSVISISLAEVLVRQGHYPEAIEMYKKLCLKFPEKSDYFAAQIKNIQAT